MPTPRPRKSDGASLMCVDPPMYLRKHGMDSMCVVLELNSFRCHVL